MSTDPILIREEQAGDASAIAALTTRAFAGSEHSSGTEAAIVAALRAADALSLSLVAIGHGAIVGHVALSPVTIDEATGPWFGLGPISVEPGRQRQGIGASLMNAAIQWLRAGGAGGCVLLGDPAYYRRFGFASDPALYYGDVPPAYFQRLLLSGAAPSGEARYHPAFKLG